MNTRHIISQIEEGKLTQVLAKYQNGICMSDGLAKTLAESGTTVFANFAYTNYGCLTDSAGILDYAVIRYFEENYKGLGCTIEDTSWNGKNMLLVGSALQHLREEFMPDGDSFDALVDSLWEYVEEYERKNFRRQAENLIANDKDCNGRLASCDLDILTRAIMECDSGMNTNGDADFSDDDLLMTYQKLCKEKEESLLNSEL